MDEPLTRESQPNSNQLDDAEGEHLHNPVRLSVRPPVRYLPFVRLVVCV